MSRSSERFAGFMERHRLPYRLFLLAENAVKKPIFGCKTCGQCVLSYTAFTCPMRCPKKMRNGPCGGTRTDGMCEVDPRLPCVWHLIYVRSKKLGRERKLLHIQPAHDHRLEGTSAILNAMAGRIQGTSLRKE